MGLGFVLCAWSCLALQASGGTEDELSFVRLGLEDGLTNGRVRHVLQDSRGFLWFGTVHGLNRYDGNEVRRYLHDPATSRSLGGEEVSALVEDQAGTLWVGTDGGGVSRYDRSEEDFTVFRHDPANEGTLTSDRVNAVFPDSSGLIWIGLAEGGICSLDPTTEEVVRYVEEQSTDQEPVEYAWIFAQHPDGDIWVLSNAGLVRCDRDRREFECFRHDPADPTSLSAGQPYDLHVDRSGVIWVATASGLDRFDAEQGGFVHYVRTPSEESPDPRVSRIYETPSWGLWVGTLAGIERFEPETGSFQPWPLDVRRPMRFPGPMTEVVVEDGQGTLWVGTRGGLNKLEPGGDAFVGFHSNKQDPRTLSHDRVWDLFVGQRGLLWVGTADGVCRVLDAAGFRFHPTPRPATGSRHAVLSLRETQDGRLWGSTSDESRTLFSVGPDDDQTFRALEIDGEVFDRIRAIHEGADGILWLGSDKGLVKFDPGDGTSHFIPTPAGVASIGASQTGKLRLSTRRGGITFDPVRGRFESWSSALPAQALFGVADDSRGGLWLAYWDELLYLDAAGDLQSFLNNERLSALHLDTRNRLWVGTMDSLTRVEEGGRGITSYTEFDGLPGGDVRAIAEDRAGRIWITTSRALASFAPETEVFRYYGAADGLPQTGYRYRALTAGASGTLYAGMNGGYLSFRPEELEGPPPPAVLFTGLELARRDVAIGGDSVLQRSITETDHLTLSYEDRVLTLRFAALSYRAPEENRYRYRLEGIDEDWIDSDQGSATYTSLPPGEYTFRVLGADHTGHWNEEGASVRISVTPPWWQTTWFRTLALGGAMGAGFLVHRFRARYLLRHNQRLEREIAAREVAERELKGLSRRMIGAQEEDRARIARELHDGVNQRLAAVAIELGTTRKALAAGSSTGKFLHELQEEVQGISEDVRQVSHELHPATLQRLGIDAALRALCNVLSAQTATHADLQCSGSGDPSAIPPELALCLYRIAQEALQNVARHADASQVETRLDCGEERVRLIVADDGVGFRTTSDTRGLGLASMEERARLLGGSVHVRTSPGAGTRVEAELPLEITPS